MNYELVYILTPKLSEDEVKSRAKGISDLLRKAGANILKEDFWGKKELAYPIKHFEEGWYGLGEFSSEPERIKEIDKALKLQEDIIRFLIVRKEEEKRVKEKKVREKKINKRPKEIERIEKPVLSKAEGLRGRGAERPKVTPKEKKVGLEELDKKLEKILGEETEI